MLTFGYVDHAGVEPAVRAETSGLHDPWTASVSNRSPLRCHRSALPTELAALNGILRSPLHVLHDIHCNDSNA